MCIISLSIQGLFVFLPLISYYINCQTANLPADFYSVTVLDSLIELAQTAQSYVTQYRADAELWLGETSSCIKSNSSTVPSTYVAGFM